jgi:hypothetical protein
MGMCSEQPLEEYTTDKSGWRRSTTVFTPERSKEKIQEEVKIKP